MPTIKNAPDGERNPVDGTEATTISSADSTQSWWAAISTIKNYIVDITDTLYSAFNHSHSDSSEGGLVAHSVLSGAGTSLHVPTYSSDSTQYLNGNGEWTVPPGTGGITYSSDSTEYLNGKGEFTVPPGGAGGDLVKIGAFTISSGNITYDSIPNTYKHLLVRGTLRSTKNANSELARVYLNNDTTTSNYDEVYWFVYTGSSSGAGDADGAIVSVPALTATANRSAQVEIVIHNYAETNFHKNVLATCSGARETGVYPQWISSACVWKNTSAITRIDIVGATGWATGSELILYGYN